MLFDRSDAIEVLEDILPTLPLVHYRNLWDPAMVLRDVVAAISRAKDEVTDPSLYRSLADAMLAAAGNTDERKAAEKCLVVAQIYDLYEHAIRERGAVDFGDLIVRPALLLESDPELRLAGIGRSEELGVRRSPITCREARFFASGRRPRWIEAKRLGVGLPRDLPARPDRSHA